MMILQIAIIIFMSMQTYYLKLPRKYFNIIGMIEKKNYIFLDRMGLDKTPNSFQKKTQTNLINTDIKPKLKPSFFIFFNFFLIFQLELTFHIILVSGV